MDTGPATPAARRTAAIKMHYLEGLNGPEIAEKLDVSVRTARKYLNSEEADEVEEGLDNERVQTYQLAVQVLREQLAEVEQEKQATDDPQEKYFRRDEHREILGELMELLSVNDLVNEMSGAKDERIQIDGSLDDETKDLLSDLEDTFEA